MKPTHQAMLSNQIDVTAFQFQDDAILPEWLAAKFHRVSKRCWQAVGLHSQLIKAKPGDWAVVIPAQKEGDSGSLIVLHENEFAQVFRPLPIKTT